MEDARRDILKAIAMAGAAMPFSRFTAYAAAPAKRPRDSRLMGQAKFVDAGGIRTRYFDAGRGDPLVLVHGAQWPATSSAEGWSSAFDQLAEHFHVYAFDKLGMGYTDNPRNDAEFTMDAITRHTHDFIQAVGIRRCVLLGHSRGALPVMSIACDYPDLVSHLVILDSTTLAPDDPNTPERVDAPMRQTPPTLEEIRKADLESTQSFRKDFITDAYVQAEYRIAQLPKIRELDRRFREARDAWARANPDLVKEHPLWARNTGPTTWWNYQSKYATLDKISAGKLKAPTIIIWGFNDPFAPFNQGVDLMKMVSKVVPRAELHVINQSGHFVAQEHPEEVTQLITGFVNG